LGVDKTPITVTRSAHYSRCIETGASGIEIFENDLLSLIVTRAGIAVSGWLAPPASFFIPQKLMCLGASEPPPLLDDGDHTERWPDARANWRANTDDAGQQPNHGHSMGLGRTAFPWRGWVLVSETSPDVGSDCTITVKLTAGITANFFGVIVLGGIEAYLKSNRPKHRRHWFIKKWSWTTRFYNPLAFADFSPFSAIMRARSVLH
jgi:hypothetical protein